MAIKNYILQLIDFVAMFKLEHMLQGMGVEQKWMEIY